MFKPGSLVHVKPGYGTGIGSYDLETFYFHIRENRGYYRALTNSYDHNRIILSGHPIIFVQEVNAYKEEPGMSVVLYNEHLVIVATIRLELYENQTAI